MDFLASNRLKYQPILHTLEHEVSEQVRVVGQSISLYAPDSQVWMLSLNEDDDYSSVWPQADVQLALLIGSTGLAEIQARYGLNKVQECHQFVHLGGPLEVKASELTIRSLTMDELDYVDERYPPATREDLAGKIAQETLFGGFLGDELIGFIGTHDEGSMGLLFIEPMHRRKGYAEALLTWQANEKKAKGLVPFGHVEVGNVKSLELQYKIGASEAPEKVYWLW